MSGRSRRNRLPVRDPASVDTEIVEHRGVTWSRDLTGRIRWWNAELNQWVGWRPGADAPPVPDGWDPRGTRLAALEHRSVTRSGWRSPYRLVPVVVALVIVTIGLLQALKPSGGAVGEESRASAALVGHCLAVDGHAGGQPRYGASSVTCTSSGAAVEVTRVVPGTPGAPSCPTGTTSIQLAFQGVRYPHVECVVPVTKHR